MAGWITLFRAIPWVDLIAAAPTIARGARKLFESTADNRAAASMPAPAGSLEARVEALEAQVADLNREIATSAEIIRSMAEHNQRLIDAVGILRLRTRVLLVAVILLTVFATIAGLSLLLG